jgi:predicted Zn finger-like uncharacterized protein
MRPIPRFLRKPLVAHRSLATFRKTCADPGQPTFFAVTEDLMRLVCPKCEAQYEVGEDAIPLAGRDVQCSDCGHGWFQQRVPAILQEAPAPQPFLAPPPFAQTARAEPAAPPPATASPRKPLDEQVMAILREEALREIMARQADAAEATWQPPGPAAPSAPHPAPLAATAELSLPRPEAPLPHQPASERPGDRRGMLSGIEEINSTLTAANTRRSDLAPPPPDPRPGFRAGFALMTGLVAAAAAAYVLAPRITTLLPQSTQAMTAYVGTVDQLRRQLDATVTTAQKRVETLLLSVE